MSSFPKAKIHRFNEDISCAPPPGTYDPKFDDKVKGVLIPKVKRFPDQQFISSSLDNLDNLSSAQLAFRTPYATKKANLTPRLTCHKGNYMHTPGSTPCSGASNSDIFKTPRTKKCISSGNYKRLEEELNSLADTHMAEITRLNSQILELQDSKNKVEKQQKDLKIILEEKTAESLKKHKEFVALKQNFDSMAEMISNEREDYKKHIEQMNEEIVSLATKKYDLETIISEKQSEIMSITEQYSHIEIELRLLREENEGYKEEIELIGEKQSELINTLIDESKEQINRLGDILKCKVSELEDRFESAQESANAEFQNSLNNILTIEIESKSRESEIQLQSCYTKIDKLQILVNQNEKEFLDRIKEVDERCRLIYRELCKVEKQRDELVLTNLEKKLTFVELQEKCDGFENELIICKENCRKYEITLKTMQKTIDTLADRLLQSENEVIRLNNVEIDLERQKKYLEEKSKFLLSDIAALRKSIEGMEEEIIRDVTNMKEQLEAKVDLFKMEADKKEGILKFEIHDKQCRIDKLQCELFKADNLVEDMKCLIKDKQFKISNLAKSVEDYKKTLISIERELGFLKNENLKQSGSIESLEKQLQSNQEALEKSNQNEIKQQSYIDGLVSDLVMEKERCEALEIENNQIKIELSLTQQSNHIKVKELQELNVKVDFMSRSLNNLQEKVILTEENKEMLEMQILSAENNVTDLKVSNGLLLSDKEELENIISELKTSLNAANEHFTTEITNLQEDNVNKAARILELSITIDTLKEDILDLEFKISNLETERNGLSLSLDKSKLRISECEKLLEDKNKTIETLSQLLSTEKGKGLDYAIEKEKVIDTLRKQDELLRLNEERAIKLQEAEGQINKLKEAMRSLQSQQKNSSAEAEAQQMREELDVMRLSLHVVTEERNKLDYELAELMGHQNIHQKIKHVNQLKQSNIELRQKADRLEIENTRLKKKLAEGKENTNIPHLDCSPKTIKNKVKPSSSPAILKDRNC